MNSHYGKDCQYAGMAKDYFLAQHGDNTIELIRWLYENWAKPVHKENEDDSADK